MIPLPDRPARRLRRCRERGFTLIELAVASLVLILALAIATRELVEAQRLFARVPRSLLGGEPELVERLLRADLKAGVPLDWWLFPGPELVLERDGRRVVWENRDGVLVRRVEPLSTPGTGAPPSDPDSEPAADPAGAPPADPPEDPVTAPVATRRMLDGILLFQWRMPSPGMIEVLIVRRAPGPLTVAHLSTPGWARRTDELEMLDVVVTSRRIW